MRTHYILLAFILACHPAQDDRAGYTISGTVLNSVDQSPVSCRVRLKGRGYIERVDTDSLGRYMFEDVPPGRFELIIGLDEPRRFVDTVLMVGSSLTINATRFPESKSAR